MTSSMDKFIKISDNKLLNTRYITRIEYDKDMDNTHIYIHTYSSYIVLDGNLVEKLWDDTSYTIKSHVFPSPLKAK